MRAATAAGIALALSGCAVMHFQNGDVESDGPATSKWHHNVLLSLVEVSPVVNLKANCDDKEWSMFTTKETFGSGFVGGLDNVATSLLTPRGFGGIDLWDPQVVEYSCAKGGTESPANPEAPGPR